nr:unnamed protein product [Callosobruchus analis]
MSSEESGDEFTPKGGSKENRTAKKSTAPQQQVGYTTRRQAARNATKALRATSEHFMANFNPETKPGDCPITEPVYPEVPITADNSSAKELLDYLDISSNYVKADRLLPFDTTIHTSNQLSRIILSDNPDIDPDYMPVETSDSEQDVHKLILREKKGRKCVRNTSEWIDVKAKKDLNLGMEHKNRKGKLILAKQMKKPCKEEQSLYEEFWKIGNHTRQWDYIARFVKTVDKKQVKNIMDGASKRKFSRNYMLTANNSEIIVCKTMFLNTFGISEQWVTTALSKIGKKRKTEGESTPKDRTKLTKEF